MKFSDSDNVNEGQIEDRRGMSGGTLALGGGGLSVVGVIAFVLIRLLGGNDTDVDTGSTHVTSSDQSGNGGAAPTPIGQKCAGVTSKSDQATFVSCVESNVQNFWAGKLGKARGYEPAKLVLFNASTRSGCGAASEATGPFYCPTDEKVYLDLSFFDELSGRFGAKGGDFAEAYVIAHEFGHHVQHLLGVTIDRGFGQSASNEASVKLELQADCYAGVWGHSAYETGKVSQSEIAQALDAAAAVGDDHIQKQAGRRVQPDTFTHGSSAMRQRWFNAGMNSGDPGACDTFSASQL